jgi:hypothetical protein
MKTRIQTLLFHGALALALSGCATSSKVSYEQLQGVRKAAQKVLPTSAQVSVTTREHTFSKSDIIISAHLLEGHSADESSPYVRGDYGTHDKLTRLVRLRCARILRSLVTEQQIPDAGSFVIQAHHGVRVTRTYGNMPAMPFGGTDTAMTIYVVKMPIPQMRDPKWSALTDEQIMARWELESNIIPTLQFRSSPFGF